MKKSLKAISFFTLVCFVPTQFFSPAQGWSAAPASSPEVQVFLPDAFQIPEDLGRIENTASSSGPALIHIQTAHGNYEAQQKIRELLHYLKRTYGIKTLFIEGSVSKLEPERLRFFPDDMPLTMKIADGLTRNAYVKGPELFLLEEKNAEAYGIENAKIYNDGGKAFLEVLTQQKKTGDFVRTVDTQIDRLEGILLNKDLRAFLKRLEDYESDRLPVMDWLSWLKTEAVKRLEMDLGDPAWQIDWPMLVRLFKLQEIEKKMDLPGYQKERGDFIKAVSRFVPLSFPPPIHVGGKLQRESILNGSPTKAFPPEADQPLAGGDDIERLLSSSFSHQSLPYPKTEILFEKMVSALPANFNYDAYPNVKLFIGHLILQSEISAGGGSAFGGKANLSEETEALADKISDKLASGPDEKKILSLLKNYRLLQKLFRLELTPQEYETILSFPSPINVRAGTAQNTVIPAKAGIHVGGKLRQESINGSPIKAFPPEADQPLAGGDDSNSMSPSLVIRQFLELNSAKRVRDIRFEHLDEMDLLFDKALEYYRFVKDRDHWMIENVEKRMKEKGIEKAVVITGGFHAQPFTDYFTDKGYRYALVSPRITTTDGREAYVDSALKMGFDLEASTTETMSLMDPAARTTQAAKEDILRIIARDLPAGRHLDSSFLSRSEARAAEGTEFQDRLWNLVERSQTLSGPQLLEEARWLFSQTLPENKAKLRDSEKQALELADAGREKHQRERAGFFAKMKKTINRHAENITVLHKTISQPSLKGLNPETRIAFLLFAGMAARILSLPFGYNRLITPSAVDIPPDLQLDEMRERLRALFLRDEKSEDFYYSPLLLLGDEKFLFVNPFLAVRGAGLQPERELDRFVSFLMNRENPVVKIEAMKPPAEGELPFLRLSLKNSPTSGENNYFRFFLLKERLPDFPEVTGESRQEFLDRYFVKDVRELERFTLTAEEGARKKLEKVTALLREYMAPEKILVQDVYSLFSEDGVSRFAHFLQANEKEGKAIEFLYRQKMAAQDRDIRDTADPRGSIQRPLTAEELRLRERKIMESIKKWENQENLILQKEEEEKRKLSEEAEANRTVLERFGIPAEKTDEGDQNIALKLRKERELLPWMESFKVDERNFFEPWFRILFQRKDDGSRFIPEESAGNLIGHLDRVRRELGKLSFEKNFTAIRAKIAPSERPAFDFEVLRALLETMDSKAHKKDPGREALIKALLPAAETVWKAPLLPAPASRFYRASEVLSLEAEIKKMEEEFRTNLIRPASENAVPELEAGLQKIGELNDRQAQGILPLASSEKLAVLDLKNPILFEKSLENLRAWVEKLAAELSLKTTPVSASLFNTDFIELRRFFQAEDYENFFPSVKRLLAQTGGKEESLSNLFAQISGNYSAWVLLQAEELENASKLEEALALIGKALANTGAKEFLPKKAALEAKLSIQKTGFPPGIVDEARRLWKAKEDTLKKDNKRRIEREFLGAFQEGSFNSDTIRNRAEKIISRWKSHANPSASPDYDQAIHSLAGQVDKYFKEEGRLRSEARSQAPENFRTWREDRRPAIEKPLIEWALTKSAGVLLEAARLLAINRNTLAKTMKEYGLTAAPYTGLTADPAAEPIKLREVLDQALIKAIEEALIVTGGNKTEAADFLGISRNHDLLSKAKRPENVPVVSPKRASAVPEKLPHFRPWPERAKEWEKGLFFAALNQAKGKNGKVKIVNLARILGVNRNTTAILFKKYKDEKPPPSAGQLDAGQKMVSIETFKKAYVITALILYQGESQETLAEKMGIDRNTLRKWTGDLNIDPKLFEKRPLTELVIENKEEIRLILNETEKKSLYEKILGEVSKKRERRETPQERERIDQAAEALGPRFALSAGSFFEIESYKPLVIQAGNLKEPMRALSDGELAEKARELKEKAAGQKERLEEFLGPAFAIFNEAARRKTGMEPSPEQMFAALAIHRGRAVEMQPGEGKTLSIALAAFVNALLGRGVHIHTFNDYLAKRDAELMTPVFSFLGLKVGLVEHSEKQRAAKRDAYLSDITYGSKELFVFDFLRDRMVYDKKEKVQKPEAPALVVVDEGDSVLLDEAADPLVAGVEQTGKSKGWPEDDIYLQVYRFAASLQEGEDFNLDPFNRDAEILPEVFADRRKELKAIRWDLEELKSMIRQALVVRYFYERKSEYVIEGNKVVLVDEFTGRLKMSHVLGNHKHQLIAAKEIVESDGSLEVKIQRPVLSHNLITYQNYYREMKEHSTFSMTTGTLGNEAPEIKQVYGLDFVGIPLQFESKMIKHPPVITGTKEEKDRKMIQKIGEIHARGNPVVIFVRRISDVENLKEKLLAAGIQAATLHGLSLKDEAEVLSQAGEEGRVTIVTNVAGRGVNIQITDRVRELGGLNVILTKIHTSRRIDDQQEERVARREDPGESYMFLSLEDESFQRFGGPELSESDREQVRSEADFEELRLKIQENGEAFLRAMRGRALAFDDALAPHRRDFYQRRDHLLNLLEERTLPPRPEILKSVDDVWRNYLEALDYNKYRENISMDTYRKESDLLFQPVLAAFQQAGNSLSARSEARGLKRPPEWSKGVYRAVRIGGASREEDQASRKVELRLVPLERLRAIAISQLSFQIKSEAGVYRLQVFNEKEWLNVPGVELKENQPVSIGRVYRPHDTNIVSHKNLPDRKKLGFSLFDMDPGKTEGSRIAISWQEGETQILLYLPPALMDPATSRMMDETDSKIPAAEHKTETGETVALKEYIRPAHLELKRLGEKILITDHGSRAGTFYEKKIEDSLTDGQSTALGGKLAQLAVNWILTPEETVALFPSAEPLVVQPQGPFEVFTMNGINVETKEVLEFRGGKLFQRDPRTGSFQTERPFGPGPGDRYAISKEGEGPLKISLSGNRIVYVRQPRSEARASLFIELTKEPELILGERADFVELPIRITARKVRIDELWSSLRDYTERSRDFLLQGSDPWGVYYPDGKRASKNDIFDEGQELIVEWRSNLDAAISAYRSAEKDETGKHLITGMSQRLQGTPESRTLVDLGSDYGELLGKLLPLFGLVHAVEKNPRKLPSVRALDSKVLTHQADYFKEMPQILPPGKKADMLLASHSLYTQYIRERIYAISEAAKLSNRLAFVFNDMDESVLASRAYVRAHFGNVHPYPDRTENVWNTVNFLKALGFQTTTEHFKVEHADSNPGRIYLLALAMLSYAERQDPMVRKRLYEFVKKESKISDQNLYRITNGQQIIWASRESEPLPARITRRITFQLAEEKQAMVQLTEDDKPLHALFTIFTQGGKGAPFIRVIYPDNDFTLEKQMKNKNFEISSGKVTSIDYQNQLILTKKNDDGKFPFEVAIQKLFLPNGSFQVVLTASRPLWMGPSDMRLKDIRVRLEDGSVVPGDQVPGGVRYKNIFLDEVDSLNRENRKRWHLNLATGIYEPEARSEARHVPADLAVQAHGEPARSEARVAGERPDTEPGTHQQVWAEVRSEIEEIKRAPRGSEVDKITERLARAAGVSPESAAEVLQNLSKELARSSDPKVTVHLLNAELSLIREWKNIVYDAKPAIRVLVSALKRQPREEIFHAAAEVLKVLTLAAPENKAAFEKTLEEFIFGKTPEEKRPALSNIKYYKAARDELKAKMPSLAKILASPVRIRRLLTVLALLREMVPEAEDSLKRSSLAPLEYARKTGKIFRLREIQIMPASESFRRDILRVGEGASAFAMELKIPGELEDRSIVEPANFLAAAEMQDRFGKNARVAKPLFYYTQRSAGGQPVSVSMYGRKLQYKTEPLAIAGFAYQEGKRLMHLGTETEPNMYVAKKYLQKIARQNGLSMEALLKQITVQSIAGAIRLHALGYQDREEDGEDLHLGNIRLREDGTIEFVADFGIFIKVDLLTSSQIYALRHLTEDLEGLFQKAGVPVSFKTILPGLKQEIIAEATHGVGDSSAVRHLAGIARQELNALARSEIRWPHSGGETEGASAQRAAAEIRKGERGREITSNASRARVGAFGSGRRDTIDSHRQLSQFQTLSKGLDSFLPPTVDLENKPYKNYVNDTARNKWSQSEALGGKEASNDEGAKKNGASIDRQFFNRFQLLFVQVFHLSSLSPSLLTGMRIADYLNKSTNNLFKINKLLPPQAGSGLTRSEARTAEGEEALRKINAWSAEEFFDKMRAGYEAGTLERISKYEDWAALKTEKKKIQGAGVLVFRKIQGQWKIFLGRQTWGNSKDFYVVPSGTVDKKPTSRYEKAAGIAELVRLKIADENDRKTAEQESVPAGALRELFEETGIRGRIAGRFNDNLVADKALRMNYFIHIDESGSPEVEKGNGELVDPRWVPLWVILQAREGKAGEAVEAFLKGGRLLEGSKLRGFNEVKKILLALAGPPAQTEEIEMEGRTRITRENAGEFLRPGKYIRHPEEGVGKIIWVEGNQKGDDRAFKVQAVYLGREGSEKHREYGENDFFGRHALVFTATDPEKEAFYKTRREGDQAKAKKRDVHQARVRKNIQELQSTRWTPYDAPFIRPVNPTGTAFIREVEGIKERENKIFNLSNASQVERKILVELLGRDLVGRTNISEGNIRSKMRSRQKLFLEKLNGALDKNGSLSEETMAKAEKNIFKSELFQKWLGFTDPATQKPVTKEDVQEWIRNGFIYVEWILKYEIEETLKIGNKILINPRPLPRSEARHVPADIAVQAHGESARSEVREAGQTPVFLSRVSTRLFKLGMVILTASSTQVKRNSTFESLSSTLSMLSGRGATVSAIKSIFLSMFSSSAPTWLGVKFSSFIKEILSEVQNEGTLAGIRALVNIIINYFNNVYKTYSPVPSEAPRSELRVDEVTLKAGELPLKVRVKKYLNDSEHNAVIVEITFIEMGEVPKPSVQTYILRPDNENIPDIARAVVGHIKQKVHLPSDFHLLPRIVNELTLDVSSGPDARAELRTKPSEDQPEQGREMIRWVGGIPGLSGDSERAIMIKDPIKLLAVRIGYLPDLIRDIVGPISETPYVEEASRYGVRLFFLRYGLHVYLSLDTYVPAGKKEEGKTFLNIFATPYEGNPSKPQSLRPDPKRKYELSLFGAELHEEDPFLGSAFFRAALTDRFIEVLTELRGKHPGINDFLKEMESREQELFTHLGEEDLVKQRSDRPTIQKIEERITQILETLKRPDFLMPYGRFPEIQFIENQIPKAALQDKTPSKRGKNYFKIGNFVLMDVRKMDKTMSEMGEDATGVKGIVSFVNPSSASVTVYLVTDDGYVSNAGTTFLVTDPVLWKWNPKTAPFTPEGRPLYQLENIYALNIDEALQGYLFYKLHIYYLHTLGKVLEADLLSGSGLAADDIAKIKTAFQNHKPKKFEWEIKTKAQKKKKRSEVRAEVGDREALLKTMIENWPAIREHGFFMFDMQKTLTGRNQPMTPGMTELLVWLLDQGLWIAINSGNPQKDVFEQVVDPLKHYLSQQGKLPLLEKLTFFATSGTVLITFDANGNPVEYPEYEHKLKISRQSEASISQVLQELAEKKFGLDDQGIEKLKKAYAADAAKKPGTVYEFPWAADPAKEYQPSVTRFDEIGTKSMTIQGPYLQLRGSVTDDFTTSITITKLPPEIRSALVERLKEIIKDRLGEPFLNGLSISTGGESSIDIHSVNANKAIALVNYVEMQRVLGRSIDLNHVYFFGDELSTKIGGALMQGETHQGNDMIVAEFPNYPDASYLNVKLVAVSSEKPEGISFADIPRTYYAGAEEKGLEESFRELRSKVENLQPLRSGVREELDAETQEKREIAVRSVIGHALFDDLETQSNMVILNLSTLTDQWLLEEKAVELKRLNEQIKQAKIRFIQSRTDVGLLNPEDKMAGLERVPGIFKDYSEAIGGLKAYLEKGNLMLSLKPDAKAENAGKIFERLEKYLKSMDIVLQSQIQFIEGNLKLEDADIAKFLQETAASPVWNKYGYKVEVGDVQKDLPVVPIQRHLLRRLIGEFAKNTTEEAARKEIKDPLLKLSARSEGSDLVLLFEDNAGGISPDLLAEEEIQMGQEIKRREKIFSLKTSSKKEKGGVGLAEAWHIVSMHGGTLRVISEPGKGTRFEIRFLLKRSEVRAEKISGGNADGAWHDGERTNRRDLQPVQAEQWSHTLDTHTKSNQFVSSFDSSADRRDLIEGNSMRMASLRDRTSISTPESRSSTRSIRSERPPTPSAITEISLRTDSTRTPTSVAENSRLGSLGMDRSMPQNQKPVNMNNSNIKNASKSYGGLEFLRSEVRSDWQGKLGLKPVPQHFRVKADISKDAPVKDYFPELLLESARHQISLLMEIFDQLSPKVQRTLLYPGIFLVFLGLKSAYVDAGTELTLEPLAEIFLNKTFAEKTHVLPSIKGPDFFYEPLLMAYKISTERQFLEEKLKILDPKTDEDLLRRMDERPKSYEEIAGLLDQIYERLSERAHRDKDTLNGFAGFLAGFPLQDVEFYMTAWKKAKSIGLTLPVLKTLLIPQEVNAGYRGMGFYSQGGQESFQYLSQVKTALDYAYSFFMDRPQARAIIEEYQREPESHKFLGKSAGGIELAAMARNAEPANNPSPDLIRLANEIMQKGIQKFEPKLAGEFMRILLKEEAVVYRLISNPSLGISFMDIQLTAASGSYTDAKAKKNVFSIAVLILSLEETEKIREMGKALDQAEFVLRPMGIVPSINFAMMAMVFGRLILDVRDARSLKDYREIFQELEKKRSEFEKNGIGSLDIYRKVGDTKRNEAITAAQDHFREVIQKIGGLERRIQFVMEGKGPKGILPETYEREKEEFQRLAEQILQKAADRTLFLGATLKEDLAAARQFIALLLTGEEKGEELLEILQQLARPQSAQPFDYLGAMKKLERVLQRTSALGASDRNDLIKLAKAVLPRSEVRSAPLKELPRMDAVSAKPSKAEFSRVETSVNLEAARILAKFTLGVFLLRMAEKLQRSELQLMIETFLGHGIAYAMRETAKAEPLAQLGEGPFQLTQEFLSAIQQGAGYQIVEYPFLKLLMKSPADLRKQLEVYEKIQGQSGEPVAVTFLPEGVTQETFMKDILKVLGQKSAGVADGPRKKELAERIALKIPAQGQSAELAMAGYAREKQGKVAVVGLGAKAVPGLLKFAVLEQDMERASNLPVVSYYMTRILQIAHEIDPKLQADTIKQLTAKYLEGMEQAAGNVFILSKIMELALRALSEHAFESAA